MIEDTGYRPSQQARNLRSKVTKLVGVIIPEIESGSVSQMVSGISEVLSVKDYQLLLADTRNNTRAELKYLRIFEKIRLTASFSWERCFPENICT